MVTDDTLNMHAHCAQFIFGLVLEAKQSCNFVCRR